MVIATADNQSDQSKSLSCYGAQLFLGPADSISTDHFAQQIDYLISQPEVLVGMAEQGRALVDGYGVYRILECMHL